MMTSKSTNFLFAFLFITLVGISALAQGAVKGRVEPARDAVLEIEAKHNLEVARYYVTRRKAYSGAIDRLQEIIDAHPDFSRMDEVLYLMGESHIKLNKPEKAEAYYNKLLKDYPESEFIKKTKEQLEKIKTGKEGKS
jgi:outer membrane protein assembly factor BamD (BamD/ComL family)